jgi:predicted heme/steroid binding protein
VKSLAQERKITQAELAENNGKNGKPAYIAYQGKVYDVSNSAFWMDGDHLGSHEAGKDLTSEIELAPHSEDVVTRYNVVGTLV